MHLQLLRPGPPVLRFHLGRPVWIGLSESASDASIEVLSAEAMVAMKVSSSVTTGTGR
jgi:hypothetical protein